MGRRQNEIENYTLSESQIFHASSTTDGSQRKYFDGEFYYKVNQVGNEGLCEYVVYRLLEMSSLSKEFILPYEQCIVNGVSGCRSKNFLSKSEAFVTMAQMYRNTQGRNDLAEQLLSLRDARERLDFVLTVVSDFGYDREEYKDYLRAMLQLDLIIQNTDRHVHNYGIVHNTKTNELRLPPIFDNGRALDTDRKDGVACTISGSFEEQVYAFGYPVEPAFTFSIEEVLTELKELEQTYEYHTLKERLAEYGNIFDRPNHEERNPHRHHPTKIV